MAAHYHIGIVASFNRAAIYETVIKESMHKSARFLDVYDESPNWRETLSAMQADNIELVIIDEQFISNELDMLEAIVNHAKNAEELQIVFIAHGHRTADEPFMKAIERAGILGVIAPYKDQRVTATLDYLIDCAHEMKRSRPQQSQQNSQAVETPQTKSVFDNVTMRIGLAMQQCWEDGFDEKCVERVRHGGDCSEEWCAYCQSTVNRPTNHPTEERKTQEPKTTTNAVISQAQQTGKLAISSAEKRIVVEALYREIEQRAAKSGKEIVSSSEFKADADEFPMDEFVENLALVVREAIAESQPVYEPEESTPEQDRYFKQDNQPQEYVVDDYEVIIENKSSDEVRRVRELSAEELKERNRKRRIWKFRDIVIAIAAAVILTFIVTLLVNPSLTVGDIVTTIKTNISSFFS